MHVPEFGPRPAVQREWPSRGNGRDGTRVHVVGAGRRATDGIDARAVCGAGPGGPRRHACCAGGDPCARAPRGPPRISSADLERRQSRTCGFQEALDACSPACLSRPRASRRRGLPRVSSAARDLEAAQARDANGARARPGVSGYTGSPARCVPSRGIRISAAGPAREGGARRRPEKTTGPKHPSAAAWADKSSESFYPTKLL
jgi:hypothetical protein